jgi:class 3 adenylate cyclase/tetratricopeptide (TPR) repeat protein
MNLLFEKYLPPGLAARLSQIESQTAAARAALGDELRRELTACAAYIPSRLVHSHLAYPQPGRISGHRWQGSLVFADLSGFTGFCEKLSVLGKQGAEEVSGVVNRLFNTLIAEVLAYRGELLKFGGDALTAFFDAETLGPNHARAATLAALAMQARMDDFAALKTRAGDFRLRLRVGVHSGQVFAAEVGSNHHIELVVTGADVNRVARAQQYAAPGEVIISAQTATLLEEASLNPRNEGFYQTTSLPDIVLPPPPEPPTVTLSNCPSDLENLALQVAALRPYLVYRLPRRYLGDHPAEMGEFRPVSVLFANFSDFSSLLARSGDEQDLDTGLAVAALNAYFRRIQTTVHHYGGIINKVDMHTHGDKLMALFGAPSANENDPLRAVSCAFDLDTALEEANTEIAALLPPAASAPTGTEPSPRLTHRIGINTGTVFAGRVGGGRRYEYTVMGPAVNLAFRLMEVADAGSILLSPATRAEVSRFVAVIDHPPLAVKGIADPIVPARALKEHGVPVSLGPTSLPRVPLVGRDAEFALLLKNAREALQGVGRVLAIVGEAGTGKTRLAEELVRTLVTSSIASDPADAVPHFQIYPGEGQSLKQNVPYVTLRTPLSHLLGLVMSQRATIEDQQEAIEHRLRERVDHLAPEFSHFLPLLSDVLGIPLSETPLTNALNTEQRHNRVQELVTTLILSASSQEPVLLVFDDLQWADSPSLELLNRLAQAAANVPLLLLLCYRSNPRIAEPWTDFPHTLRTTLEELSDEHSAALLEAMLEGSPPRSILPLLARTQGNPFFIEELVRALIASGALARTSLGHWHLTCPLDQVAVPTSIEGMIMSRLDRLEEPYHELVQVASVIGYRFQLQVLEGIYRYPHLLHSGLQRLIEADVITTEEKQNERSYLFRHALLHDVAYEGILYAQRRELHRRVAQWIEALSTGHLDEHLALLARHYLLAEDWEASFRYHLSAGIQAQRRFANQEALRLFATGLEIAPNLLQEVESRQHQGEQGSQQDAAFPFLPPIYGHSFHIIFQVSELHERRAYIYMLLGEFDQARPAYQESLRLINQLMQEYEQWRAEGKHFPISHTQLSSAAVRLHRHIAALYEQHSDYDEAFDWLKQGMQCATPESQGEFARCYLLGSRIYYNQGEFDQSLEWAQRGLAVAEYLGNTIDQAHALLLMGNLWRDRGEFRLSIPALEQARTLLDLMKDATRLSEALKNLGYAYWRVGRWSDATKCYQKSLQISENVGDIRGMAQTSNSLANVMVGQGELQLAADLYQYSSKQFQRIGSLQGLAMTGSNQGEVLLLQGQPRDALHLLRASIVSLERIKARNNLSEALRLAAEASLALGQHAQAMDYIGQSFAIARELGMAVEEAVGLRVMGEIALDRGDFPAASEYLSRSRAMLDRLDNPYELGKVLYWQARLAQAHGPPDDLLLTLQQAEQIFKNLRARRDLGMVRECMATIQARDE